MTDYDDGLELDLPQVAAIVILIFLFGFLMGTQW